MSEDQQIEVFPVRAEVQGRYLLRRAATESGAADSGGAPLLVAYHGYGENAERLLEDIVEVPVASAWNLVSVQALHPFYNRRTGEVVASWMTKIDREAAISDNVAFVDKAITDAREQLDRSGPVVHLGFSQGTSMAYRAAFGTRHAPAGLIALAGDLPPEVRPREDGIALRVLIGCGTRDEWYDEAKMENDVARLDGLAAEVETCIFDGGHEWTHEFRAAAANFLRSIA